MALTPFNAKTVKPGEPLTAQAWNDLVNALASVYDYIETSQASSARVQVTNSGIDLQKVRVTATRADAPPVEAIKPIPPAVEHTLSGLISGDYTVQVSAPGFQTASVPLSVPRTDPLTITLVASGALMPSIFGQTLNTALGTLKGLNISVARIVDVTGRDVAPEAPSAEYTNAPVLLQLPAAGEPVPPGSSAQLVVAVALKADPSVVMPSLAGLTLAEAQKALESLGLVLGKVETKTATRS